MNRRDFLSGFSKLSLVPMTASIATAASIKSRNIAENSMENIEKQFKSLKNQYENLENNQKKMAKALVLLTAVSTGVDLSLIL
jgi:hypothetical protein